MTPGSPPPVRRSRSWMAYFLLLFVLAASGMVIPIFYNLGLQLRPEQLAEARARWAEAGPRDYDLTFSVAYGRERTGSGCSATMAAPAAQRHIVLVRGGRIVCALCEGEVDYL